jgi:hypothetical protein
VGVNFCLHFRLYGLNLLLYQNISMDAHHTNIFEKCDKKENFAHAQLCFKIAGLSLRSFGYFLW